MERLKDRNYETITPNFLYRRVSKSRPTSSLKKIFGMLSGKPAKEDFPKVEFEMIDCKKLEVPPRFKILKGYETPEYTADGLMNNPPQKGFTYGCYENFLRWVDRTIQNDDPEVMKDTIGLLRNKINFYDMELADQGFLASRDARVQDRLMDGVEKLQERL
ncbi:hypothetical protein ACFLZZ_01305 [Nanoarchaeota archaeon]